MAGAFVLLVSTGCADPAPSPTGDETGGEPLFRDETTLVGIDFVHFNGMTGEMYMAENVGGGGALADFDGDGDLDLFLAQGAMLGPGRTLEDAVVPLRHPGPVVDRLYRNDLTAGTDGSSTLRFTDVTADSGLRSDGYGMGVATGDFDNDGRIDIYVTNFGSNGLFRNNGDGTFTDVTASAGADDARWSVPAAFFDYDNDGWLDLFVGNYVDFRIANHRECRSAGGYRDYCGPQVYAGVPDRLLRNRGDGTFEDTTISAGLGAANGRALGAVPADFNLDGWIDLYVANDGMANHLWMNNGDGTFRDDALMSGCALNGDGAAEASMGVDAGDLDNDGDEDLVMSHIALETNTVYVNDGNAGFEDRSRPSGLGQPSWIYTGFGAGWLDFDNDSWLDFVVVNGAVATIEELHAAGDSYPFHQPNQLYRNTGGGLFEDVTARVGEAFASSEVSRGVAFGDVDNDGDTDFLVVNNNGPARLMINQLDNDNHWVGLRLIDPATSRDAFGAWVHVSGPGIDVWRRVRTARSYAAASDPRLLIGLGTSTDVSEIVVQWPGGTTESWSSVPADSYTTLVRGTGREAGE